MSELSYSIKRKRIPFVILSLICTGAAALGLFVNYRKGFQNLEDDLFYIAVLIVAAVLFALPLFRRIDFLLMTKEYVTVRGIGTLSWTEVNEVWILNKRGYKGSSKRVIEFTCGDGTKQDLDLWLLNIDEEEFFDALEQTDFCGEFGFEE